MLESPDFIQKILLLVLLYILVVAVWKKAFKLLFLTCALIVIIFVGPLVFLAY